MKNIDKMLLKKFKIGRVGVLRATYKRVYSNGPVNQESICKLCGVGERKCMNLYVGDLNESRITYYALCYSLSIANRLIDPRSSKKYVYIPSDLR